ncbi:DUF4911 domain-containing protein [Desulfurivibrio alkaliphilus]|uniref:DUF4911 domain-containing protein n=1 Tax=Desulfurivibrio alkaliphilus (strain DSM 19089 / UNIQEM U267 / AHT2) TaxID=589865 RepID=D6Z1T1_DESAT|nr:DUF4911 domain-containing protein [Desulfurivibrio alkaliphilus]ADH85506.1 hypothetical protein DaAHT2_0802 [Desulfurivibrio alkaliphilus AHT 2]
MNSCSESLVLTVTPEKIGLFRFILESYDNLAILTTLDRHQGVVMLRYPAGNQAEIEELLTALPLQLGQAHPNFEVEKTVN